MPRIDHKRCPESMGDCRDCTPTIWSLLDYSVSQAQSAGLNVLLVISAAPTWANGNPDPSCSSIGNNNPCGSGQFSNGYAPFYGDDLRDLSYSLTAHFGSSVQAVEAWNEPNSAAQFNVDNMPGIDWWAEIFAMRWPSIVILRIAPF